MYYATILLIVWYMHGRYDRCTRDVTLVVVVAQLGGGLSAREDLRLGGALQLPN